VAALHQKAVTQYLGRYAEGEVRLLDKLRFSRPFSYALCIPAYKESSEFLQLLADHPQSEHVLLILVVNRPREKSLQDDNSELLNWISSHCETISEHHHLTLLSYKSLSILCINRNGKGQLIPHKQGVGLARKIAADIALALIENKQIDKPWIFTTDADARLPNNYFDDAENSFKATHAAAQCFGFVHGNGSPELNRASKIYERCMLYYRDSLSMAGSPYAFCTIGSCLAIDAIHYAKVRGFPKLSAGEDFYLLNKIAKTGDVINTPSVSIHLTARASDRVPFGTGPAVQQLTDQLKNNEIPLYYSPRIFGELKVVLSSIERLWLAEVPLDELSQEQAQCMSEAGLAVFIDKRKSQDKNFSAFEKSFHAWFDAFQTLKFVHRMQKYFYPAVPIDQIFEH
jgi:hypothetical protein